MRFASDNTSGAAPEIMAAILKANDGYERSYGADAAMAVAEPSGARRQVGAGEGVGRHVEEVVAVGVGLDERRHAGRFRQKASRCQP